MSSSPESRPSGTSETSGPPAGFEPLVVPRADRPDPAFAPRPVTPLGAAEQAHPAARLVPVSVTAAPLPVGELRSGTWTRRGGSSLLGDPVTEGVLGELADQTRAAARSEGWTAGWAEGRRAVDGALAQDAERHRARLDGEAEAWRARHDAVLAALGRAADELRRATAQVQDDVRGQALELALELTEALVGHQVRLPGAGRAALERALAARPEGRAAVVRLGPEAAADAREAELPDSVSLRADPRLGPGDAVVELDDRVLDLRVGPALDRLREVLS